MSVCCQQLFKKTHIGVEDFYHGVAGLIRAAKNISEII